MTLVCRPIPIVRFMPMSEQGSQQLMHCMARRFRGSIFTHGPAPGKPPKRYSVANMQKN